MVAPYDIPIDPRVKAAGSVVAMTTTDAGTPGSTINRFESVQSVRDSLRDVSYLADEGIAGVAYLADRLGKPVLVEGPAGTGKTQLAKSIAEITDARLIRLQCYEGLDESKALYEWNYKKQLLRIQTERGDNSEDWTEIKDDIFSDELLLTRPLLEAITATDPVVLLIEEVDRVGDRGPAVVSVMWANNETGVVFPVEKLARTINEVPGKFVRTLAAVRDQKQAAA